MKKLAYILLFAAAPVVANAAGSNSSDTVIIKPEPIVAKGVILPEPLKATTAKAAATQPAAGTSMTPPPPPPPAPAKTEVKKTETKAAAPKTAAKKVEVRKEVATSKKTEVKAAPKTAAKKEAALAPAKAIEPYNAATDDPQLKELNKKHLVDFLKSAKANDVGSFYRANPQFKNSLTEDQFVKRFSQYSALDDDTAAIAANDFSATTINKVEGNKRYKSCQLIEAESKVTVQVVQDAHKYTIHNKYCKVSDGFKLVSFKFGYDQ